ncbi:hypothetical protein Lfu02_61260 [Longispora fulva]|uniref:Ricin B lectin domain-containing protein n=1 Tax=Longispora fulva TaxID=619741 RepID=A0A8J7GMU0_9ACTN|nr:RICIN domain-containing protein [Longispora fulva]MBG6134548.1 hypothetical protein [Longispora fulva]GIG61754.1 hypothetical protein Lfu02_61260 [Longispora fulva]
MSRYRRGFLAAAAAVALMTVAPSASATPPAANYTISISALTGHSFATDSPASGYIDKDGTFYFQQSAALYGATEPRYWDFYTGTNFDTASRSSTISNAVNPGNANDKNNDTSWRCDNSPTGATSTNPPTGSGYAHRNYCDLMGTWVDPDTGNWYGLVHNEFTPEPFGSAGFSHYDAIDYAVSTNQGKVWTITGHAITSPYSTTRGDDAAFPNQTWYYGDGDPRLLVDPASGYFYVFYNSRVNPKYNAGGSSTFGVHVARAPMSQKMATGSWQKWYNGTWTQPGVGGQESNMVPVTSPTQTGYTPVANSYNPANTGTTDQQIAAGKIPPKSDLFLMNVSYNAYLGLYIAEPEVQDQSVPTSQKFYVTDDLSTQKWYLMGDSGNAAKSGSWYRWMVDSVNKTGSTIVGRSFRSYCSINCSGGSGGNYYTATIDSSQPAAAPVDTSKTYTISSGSGRVLAQVSGSSATTSVGAATGSGLEAWSFASLGDGAFRITNAATGQALGVDAATTATRAWGTKPTVTASTGSVGQQWFIVRNETGAFRIVNRYSQLVLGMSSDSTRLTETTPHRAWTNTTGNAVGGNRTAAEQTLTLTQTSTPGNLNGTHTLRLASGNLLDVWGGSVNQGQGLITWYANGGTNQNWVLTQQSDGAYTLVNGRSNFCAGVSASSTAPGASVIQWSCTGVTDQRWQATQQANGSYTLTNVNSGLLLTASSTGPGATISQQSNTNSPLQQWSIS